MGVTFKASKGTCGRVHILTQASRVSQPLLETVPVNSYTSTYNSRSDTVMCNLSSDSEDGIQTVREMHKRLSAIPECIIPSNSYYLSIFTAFSLLPRLKWRCYNGLLQVTFRACRYLGCGQQRRKCRRNEAADSVIQSTFSILYNGVPCKWFAAITHLHSDFR